MRKKTNRTPLTPTPTIHQTPGKNPSNFHPTQHTPPIQTIHRHRNIPPGSHGQNGQTGASPMILPSQRDNGRTTRSPTINPIPGANGLTTQSHHTLTLPNMTLPLVRSLHFPLILLTVITIPHANNADPDPLNPDNPHSLQGMSLWTYMEQASKDGSQM